MSQEQHVHGVSHWHIPSPSTTPQSTTSSNNPFRTPKPEPYNRSFHNVNASHVNGHCTAAGTAISTPQPLVFTPTYSRASSSLGQDSPGFPVHDIYATTASPGLDLSLPSVEFPQTLFDFRVEQAVKGRPGKQNLEARTGDSVVMEPSQIRTPPPTRDSSSKRRGQKAKVTKLSTPASTTSRRLSTPVTSSRSKHAEAFVPQTLPLQFTPLDFSQDGLNFAPTGIATAPAYPTPRLLWDPDGNMTGMDFGASALPDDPFGTSPSVNMAAVSWASFNTPVARGRPEPSVSATFETPKPGNFFVNSGEFMTGELPTEGRNMTSQRTVSPSASSGVDPNLLVGFSNQTDLPSMQPLVTASSVAPTPIPNKQPYEHQLQESMREKEIEQARKAKQQHRRTNKALSAIPPKQESKSILQRSFTMDDVARKSHHAPKPRSLSTRETFSNGENNGHIPRRSSPLKRQTHDSLPRVSEIRQVRPRNSVRLTIDASGRARTENSILEESEEATEDDEEDLRAKYPALWDGDETDTSSDLSVGYVNSQNNSFAAPDLVNHRSSVSKSGRDGNSFRRTPSRKSSSVTTSASAGLQKPDTASRLQQRTSELLRFERNRRHTTSSVEKSSLGEVDSDNDTLTGPDEVASDAQQALKKVVEGRQRRHQRPKGQDVVDAHNQRWTQALQQPPAPLGGTYQDIPYGSHGTIRHSSPTTITDPDLATPSTDHGYINNEATRCVCSNIDGDGGLMIQCESCFKWQHIKCLGLTASRLPAVHICGFCAGHTPAVRGGRVRDPNINNLPFSSPLAHKNIRYR